jgi:arylsulfatase A-like enzyme
VIVISMDTVRADVAADPTVAPNLARFAGEAVNFTQAWSVANTTSMSHAATFTSRYPSELGHTGPTFNLGTTGTTMAEMLGVYGYRTAAFTGGAHFEPGWGLDRGFSEYAATAPLGSFWQTAPAARDWLTKNVGAGPAFLFVHGYDAHAPYLDPAPYGLAYAPRGYDGPALDAVRAAIGTEAWFDKTLFTQAAMPHVLAQLDRPRPWDAAGRAAVAALAETEVHGPVGEPDAAFVKGVYRGAVAYADANVGWLLDQLRAEGRFDDSVIVVMSDHGETLDEDGRFGHGHSLADEELHVPLLVHVPHGKAATVTAPVSLLDLLPTVAELVGARPPAGARGVSLRGVIEGAPPVVDRTVFSEGNNAAISARSPAGRLTFSGIDADSVWLRPLLEAAQPTDQAWTLDSTAPEADRAALRGALVQWRQAVSPAGPSAPTDPALVEKMRQRGYFTP